MREGHGERRPRFRWGLHCASMANWGNAQGFESLSFTCGYCGNLVASTHGYASDQGGEIRICPHCTQPTYLAQMGRQIPGVPVGNDVEFLPEDVKNLYEEARNCVAANAFTSSVMVSRKLLMHLGVEKGAPEGETFVEYVEYLADQGYVPPAGKGWVDHIRKKGNEANHEIVLMGRDEAVELITFLEMLLKFIYEFPSKVPSAELTT
jgi:hypothetical protein